ncbi:MULTISPECIES: RDD family protein [unclassified Pseudoalteromonas]|uniref:RDD family protein n=1 Tax=unclassified Pseudoalteromonas TaxID=194690 RepID=UPI000C075142|nr:MULTISPECIES: RDD family protein [unclassified Pseudoalteromonas]MDP2635057.1 RDD family protein [Pseudoalteromonas sp. 1_MG-2023]PHN89498.1 RDD family protein [Pseudoalteromonas sp. 3D05]
MKVKEMEELALTRAETKEVITPYAFKIDQALLGLPLASPTRRALAMLIDVMLIFLAAKLSAALIAFVATVAFYKGTAQKHLPKMNSLWRRILKLTAATLLFFSSLYLLSVAIDYFDGDTVGETATIQQDIILDPEEIQAVNTYLKQTQDAQLCDQTCQATELASLVSQVAKLTELNELSEVNEIEHINMAKGLLDLIIEASEQSHDEQLLEETESIEPQANSSTSHSILKWGIGIIEDLGLGFGWAAIYFTLFALLWKGQTPGKKICNIRVVALNGEQLGLLDCFGRYGGYGAGFATGLLGFLQVYWDPNRQAIQDKISATVVIKGSMNQPVNIQTIEEAVSE